MLEAACPVSRDDPRSSLWPWCKDLAMRTTPKSTEAEPDYRMSLAAERTYLAYVRTALAMLAAGVAAVGALSGAGHEGLRRVIGVVLVLTGLLVAATARTRWRRVDRAIREGRPLPPPHSFLAITLGTVAAGFLCLALVIWL